MYSHGIAHPFWNERFGSTHDGNSNVYYRSQDMERGSSSSASNDTEYTTLLDESYQKSDLPYENIVIERDRHSRGSRKNKIFLVFIALCIICTLVIGSLPYGNTRARVGQIAGWGMNTSRQTIDYVLPYENTTLIEPFNVCSTEERAGLLEENEKVFLLVVVCSSANNFEARQTIRETWGNVREFNYDQFRLLHASLRGEYLDPNAGQGERLKDYMWLPSATVASAAVGTEEVANGVENNDHAKPDSSRSIKNGSAIPYGNFNIKVVFLVGLSESDYVHQQLQQQQTPLTPGNEERSSTNGFAHETPAAASGNTLVASSGPTEPLFPSGADVDPAFNVAPGAVIDELQLRIVNESEMYGDIIQESFIDSYNNLTLKTIMMLKWVTNNCDGKENISNKERRFSNKERNKEYLQFQLDARDYTGDIHARMMVYVHGEDWWRKNGRPATSAAAGSTAGGGAQAGDMVAFAISKMAKGAAEIARFQGSVPKGEGRFLEFNVTNLVLQWFKERDHQMPGDVGSNSNKYVVLETYNDLSRRLVVHNPNGGQFVLLGGTVPLYKAAISFYDSNTVAVKSAKNRLTEGKHLLTGFLFCDAKPIGDPSSKWYSPTYMYNKDVYPNYLSGTAYLMNFEAAKALYRASLSTPIFHLEDVYLTGIVAGRVKIRRRHHPLFFYSYTKDLCALRGMISQHQLQPGEIRKAYDFITNSSIVCKGPEKRFIAGKMKLQQRKNEAAAAQVKLQQRVNDARNVSRPFGPDGMDISFRSGDERTPYRPGWVLFISFA